MTIRLEITPGCPITCSEPIVLTVVALVRAGGRVNRCAAPFLR